MDGFKSHLECNYYLQFKIMVHRGSMIRWNLWAEDLSSVISGSRSLSNPFTLSCKYRYWWVYHRVLCDNEVVSWEWNASVAGRLYGKIVTEIWSHYWSFNTYMNFVNNFYLWIIFTLYFKFSYRCRNCHY